MSMENLRKKLCLCERILHREMQWTSTDEVQCRSGKDVFTRQQVVMAEIDEILYVQGLERVGEVWRGSVCICSRKFFHSSECVRVTHVQVRRVLHLLDNSCIFGTEYFAT